MGKRAKNGYQPEQACLFHYRIPYSSPLTLFTASLTGFFFKCIEMTSPPVVSPHLGMQGLRCYIRCYAAPNENTRTMLNALEAKECQYYVVTP